MKLDELQHVLRASAAIAKESSFVVVGSQAVLLLLDHPPEALLVSREIDLYPALHPERADLIDGAIGMLDAAKYPLPHLIAWVERRKQESERATP
jgi:hypothetical protein